MTDRLMALFAFALLAAFLGVLVIYVPRLDLTAFVLTTLLFVGYDFFVGNGGRRRR
jgi:hypothetical protein